MTRRASPFDPPATPSNELALGIDGSRSQLSRAQKQFNKLLRDIATLRERLAEWNDYPVRFQRQLDAQALLHARLREVRIRMCAVFDSAILGGGLGKSHCATAREVLETLLVALIEEAADDALLAMAARHGIEAEEADFEMDLIESMASEVFGVDLGDDHGASTPEELLELLREHAATAEAAAAERAARRKPRRKSEKARQREAHAEQVARDASQALREVYRKLARDLHPDRIAEPEERTRKTALMQEANRAYEAGDLLTLLQLQWQIEQIDPTSMAGLADEKLARFIHTLKEQVGHLRDEIDAVALPYLMSFQSTPPREPHPRHVDRELEHQRAGLKQTLAQMQEDLRRYADPAALKSDLKGPLREMLEEQRFFERVMEGGLGRR